MQRLCSALLCLAAFAATAQAATVKGTVTDFSTGNRLPNMVVAAYSVSGILQANATTDSNGNYALSLPPGQYRLLAYDNSLTYATTYAGDADSFETSTILSVAADISGVNFALRIAGTVTGTVLGAATGATLGGMTVAAYNSATGTRRGFTQTDNSGRYTLVLPPGLYRVAAYDNNGAFAVRFFDDQPTFATATDISVVASQARIGTNFRLAFAAHLTGTVVDADTNLPLAGRTVTAYAPDASQIASTTTDAFGTFTVSVAPGSYKFIAVDMTRVYATGYVGDANSFTNEPAVSAQTGQNISGVQIPMHRAGVVNGEIRDSSGSQLSAITIAAYNDDGTQRATAQSGTGGAYSLLLPPGTFRLAAFDPALTYASAFYPDRILFADATPITVTAGATTNSVDLTLVRGGKISGTVADQQNGSALAGITVAAYDDNGNLISSGVSAASGKYALVVPPGSYRFAAFDNQLRYITAYSGGASNFESASSLSVLAASASQLNFGLIQGVLLTGSVLDASAASTPVSNVQVGALDALGNRVAAATAVNGAFNLVLPPGTYRLLATDPLGRFFATFYANAWTLATATPIVVSSNGSGTPITILLTRETRRRAVHG